MLKELFDTSFKLGKVLFEACDCACSPGSKKRQWIRCNAAFEFVDLVMSVRQKCPRIRFATKISDKQSVKFCKGYLFSRGPVLHNKWSVLVFHLWSRFWSLEFRANLKWFGSRLIDFKCLYEALFILLANANLLNSSRSMQIEVLSEMIVWWMLLRESKV